MYKLDQIGWCVCLVHEKNEDAFPSSLYSFSVIFEDGDKKDVTLCQETFKIVMDIYAGDQCDAGSWLLLEKEEGGPANTSSASSELLLGKKKGKQRSEGGKKGGGTAKRGKPKSKLVTKVTKVTKSSKPKKLTKKQEQVAQNATLKAGSIQASLLRAAAAGAILKGAVTL
jgi:hypothetical protein